MKEHLFETVDKPIQVLTVEQIKQAEESHLRLFEAGGSRQSADISELERAPASLGHGGFGRVDEHSGAYSYGVNVFCPTPQNGAPAPHISIVYNSMSSKAPSLIGAGWRLELGRIVRQGREGGRVNFKNDQGSEESNDHFVLELNGRSYTLVKVEGQPHRFRMKIEQPFMEAERFLSDKIDPASGEPEIDYWDLYLADGSKLRYGVAGAAGEEEAPGELRNKIWNLISVENSYGHKVVYEYESYKNVSNPTWKEMAYSYPARVKVGVTPDGQFFDSLIEFVYSDEAPPSQMNGYYNLGVDYTGRENGALNGFTCILWRRLTEIRTLYRNEDGAFEPSRSVQIKARRVGGLFRVEQLEEVGYKNGAVERDAPLPAHRFTYISKGQNHPALMVTATNPFGKVDEVTYDLATNLDQGTPHAIGGIYLVKAATERAGDESWTKQYRYWDGMQYTPFEEYRGHSRIDVIDMETGCRTETHFHQFGVLNGQVKRKTVYDTEGKRISHTENHWLVMDYGGGRLVPFVQRAVSKDYAEDGETVLTTVESVIPALDKSEWKYALDEFANVLSQVSTTYEGDIDAGGQIVQKKRIDSRFKNVVEPGKTRLVGMLIEKKEYTQVPPSDEFVLVEWIEADFNDKGQMIESAFHFDRNDPGKVYRKSTQYDPYTGKLTRVYRHDGNDKQLIDETHYFQDGPYRFLISRVSNAKGQTEQRLRYDMRYRFPTQMIEKGGMVLETDFDGLGRPTMELFTVHQTMLRRGAPKVSVRYTYKITPDERSIEIVNIHTGTSTKQYFDQLNRKIRTEGTGFKGQRVIETITFDHRTRSVSQISELCYEGQPSPGFTTTEFKDARLRPTKVIYPSGHVLRYNYDGFTTTTYQDIYDRREDGTIGQLLHTELSEVTRNALGQIVRRAEGQPGQPTRYETRQLYDFDNRLVEVTDSLGVKLSQIEYGSRLDGLPIASMDVSLGRAVFEYDGFARLKVTRQDFKASLDRVTTFAYDDLDRVIETVIEDTVDGSRRTVRTTYDRQPFGVGALAEEEVVETNSLGRYARREAFDYDEFGNPISKVLDWEINWPALGIDKSLRLQTGYQHNGEKGGRLERLTYPALDGLPGGEATYHYDDLSGYLTEIRFDQNAVWKVGASGYTPRGTATEIMFGNGVSTRYDYDPKTGLATRMATRRGAATLLDQAVIYDTAANVRRRQTRATIVDESGSEKQVTRRGIYSYDDKNQLTQAMEDAREQSFIYRCDGSRLRFIEKGAETTYHYEGKSPHQVTRLAGAQDRRLIYDAAGNLIDDANGVTKTSCKLYWGPSNRLHKLEVLDAQEKSLRQLYYGYSPDNDRTFMYDRLEDRLVLYGDDQFDVEWHRKDDRVVLRAHLTNGARRFATVEQEKGQPVRIYYFHRDQLQSTSLVTGGTGEVACSLDYEPYGRVAEKTGPYQPDQLFTGQRAEVVNYEGFSLYDYLARWYDPVLGIFISPDPTEDTKNVAFGLNRYCYVGNNPLTNIDPKGTDTGKRETFVILPDIAGRFTEEASSLKDKIKKLAESTGADVIELSNEWELEEKWPNSKHVVFFGHGMEDNLHFTQRFSMAKMGVLAAKADNESVTLMVCGAGVTPSGQPSELYFKVGASTVVGKDGPLPLFNATSSKNIHHGPHYQDFRLSEPGGTVDLNARYKATKKEVHAGAPKPKVFKEDRVQETSAKYVDEILGKDAKGITGKALKGVSKFAKGGLKALDIKGNIETAGAIGSDLYAGNYWNASKKTADAATDYIPHTAALKTGYMIGDTINKVTNNYVPNKIASGLESLGAVEAYLAADRAIKWFKSWW